MVANPKFVEQESDLTAHAIIITPSMAAEWLDAYRYERQRRLNWPKVRKYVALHQSGKFQVSEIVIAHMPGKSVVINGQHRLQMIVEADLPYRAIVRHQRFDNEQQVADAYASFDPPQGSRSVRDALMAANLAERLELSGKELGVAASAVSVLARGFSIRSVHNSEMFTDRVEGTAAWGAIAAEYFQCVSESKGMLRRRLMTGAVAAVGLVTLRYCRQKAEEFWTAVGNNDGLAKGTPAHTLINQVLLETGDLDRDHILARYVAWCWNAHYERRGLSVVRGGDWLARPISIKGTPFNGKQSFRFPPGSIDEEVVES